MYGVSLLSKVCDEQAVNELKKHDMHEEHFATEAEQKAFRYILEYADENGGAAPDGAFLEQFGEGLYFPGVQMTFDHLAKQVKDEAFFRRAQQLFDDSKLQSLFEEGDREKFETRLTQTLENITMETSVRDKVGQTLYDLKGAFYDEFLNRKAGKSHRLWLSPFASLNGAIGGFYSSDVYGILAESGRGKSYLLIAIVDELLRQGANVLVKSYELKMYSWLSRLLSVITARESFFKDEQGQSVGLPNKGLLSGDMDVETEAYFADFIERIDDYYPGRLHLQSKGDIGLTRTLNDLNSELAQQPEIDVVVLDPFYGLSDVYGNNANKTKGGAAEQAARRFEQIVGAHDVAGFFAVQAQTEKDSTDEDGMRELDLPTRDQTKTSKALLEIATNLIAFDIVDGEGLIGVDKGRNGGEGFEVPLLALLDNGVLQEFPSGSELPF